MTKGRVTQWITAGLIDGAAIVGEGRMAMIDVDIARVQLKERRAVNESNGLNGLNTKLDDAPAPRAPSATPQGVVGRVVETNAEAMQPLAEDPETVDARIKAEKLKQNEILTRKQELEEKTRYGAYVVAREVTGELNRLTSEMVRIFEGCLPDLASAVAAKFQVSQREVLHLLRSEFEQAREQLVTAGEAAAVRSE